MKFSLHLESYSQGLWLHARSKRCGVKHVLFFSSVTWQLKASKDTFISEGLRSTNLCFARGFILINTLSVGSKKLRLQTVNPFTKEHDFLLCALTVIMLKTPCLGLYKVPLSKSCMCLFNLCVFGFANSSQPLCALTRAYDSTRWPFHRSLCNCFFCAQIYLQTHSL